jgi:hypothetical protein
LRVSIIDGGYPEMGITAERLGTLKRVIYRLPEGEAIPLFHDSFLSGGAADVICVDEQAKEWLSGFIPRLSPWEGASLQTVSLPVF